MGLPYLLYGLGASLSCLSWGLIIVGILSCFFGFGIFKWSLRISGFFVGAAIGVILAIAGRSDSIVLVAILALVFGVLGAILAVPLHFLFTFLQGALIGAILVEVLFLVFGNFSDAPVALIVVGAIIAGVLAVAFEVSYIIISTSITGALAIVFGANLVLGDLSSFLSLLAIVGLSAVGIYIQFKRLPPKALQASTPTVICPHCGAVNDSGRAVCIRCGYFLTGPTAYRPPTPVSAPVTPPPAQTIVCPRCKTTNQIGYGFCKNCGYPLASLEPQPGVSANDAPVASVLNCPKCGMENPTTASFCGACGTSLRKPAPQSGV